MLEEYFSIAFPGAVAISEHFAGIVANLYPLFRFIADVVMLW